ncbi:MAG TPA: alpha/beta hydrolase [Thermoanaerobaculia bacterium]|jgi:pimeloyl-ACP methyl ester carboxylesterase|nr:alpha/beta hydrolase [Thermoanaerobaculia bacterium]
MSRLHSTGFALAVLAAVGIACSHAAGPKPALTLKPCTLEGIAGQARCGNYEVPEDRGNPNGRKIALRVVVLPATGTDHAPDPVISFAGGPGQSSVDEAAGLAAAHARLRARRDVVLVDLRGTGGSVPLLCKQLMGEHGVQGFLDDFLPAAAVRACRADQAGRDLAQYRTAVAVDDVAEVLAALGYDQVNAWGGSYGTRAALELAQRHPRLVRTLGLIGVVPPDARMPSTFARDAQDALDGTLRECAGDAACAAAFPHVREELDAVLARAAKEPVTVTVRDPASGESHELRLTRQGVAQTIRYMLYLPSTAVLIPLHVHAAAEGDFQPLGKTAALFARFAGGMSDGFFLSVTCSEDVPFIGAADAATGARGTFLYDFRVRAQQAACREWNVSRAPAAEVAPVTGPVPALLVSGERDPVTPGRWGDEVARTLPNAVHVIVPDGGHGTEGMRGAECIDRLLDELVERGTTRGLDTSCVAKIERPAFATELPPKEAALTAAQRNRLLGRYAGADGMTVVVEPAGDRLRLNIVGEDSFLLVPRSATRFGFESLPPNYAVEVDESGGKVTGLRLIGMADEPMVLKRQP